MLVCTNQIWSDTNRRGVLTALIIKLRFRKEAITQSLRIADVIHSNPRTPSVAQSSQLTANPTSIIMLLLGLLFISGVSAQNQGFLATRETNLYKIYPGCIKEILVSTAMFFGGEAKLFFT